MEYAIRNAGLWDQVREVVLPVNVNPLTGTITGELAAEACFRALGQRGGRALKRHHALADALALRAAYIDVRAAALAHARSTFRESVSGAMHRQTAYGSIGSALSPARPSRSLRTVSPRPVRRRHAFPAPPDRYQVR